MRLGATKTAGNRRNRRVIYLYADEKSTAFVELETVTGAKFVNRSHHAVIRVYDEPGDVIEMHEHKGDSKEPSEQSHPEQQGRKTNLVQAPKNKESLRQYY